MTDAPERIYLQDCGDDDCKEPFSAHHEVTWCEDQIHERDVPYVRADRYDALAERVDALRNTLTDALDYIVTLRETIETIHKLYPTLTVTICGTTLDEEAARRLAAPSAPKEP